MSVYDDVKTFMQVAGQDTPSALVEIDPIGSNKLHTELVALADMLVGWGTKSNDGALRCSTDALAHLRMRLMTEELGETARALTTGNMVEFADGLADLIYVAVGTAIAYGIPLDRVWDEVQRSNMAKFPTCANCGGKGFYADEAEADLPSTNSECASCNGHGRVAIRDAGGKVQKPPGWTPPDVAGVLAQAQSHHPDYLSRLIQRLTREEP